MSGSTRPEATRARQPRTARGHWVCSWSTSSQGSRRSTGPYCTFPAYPWTPYRAKSHPRCHPGRARGPGTGGISPAAKPAVSCSSEARWASSSACLPPGLPGCERRGRFRQWQHEKARVLRLQELRWRPRPLGSDGAVMGSQGHGRLARSVLPWQPGAKTSTADDPFVGPTRI
jgi:hypothetical protein